MIWIVFTPAGPHEVDATSYEGAMAEWKRTLYDRLNLGAISQRQFREQWPTGAELAPRERKKVEGAG